MVPAVGRVPAGNDHRRDPSHPPLPYRASPPQGGRLSARPPSPISNAAEAGEAPKLLISPLAGEMAGRPEGGTR
ncbi:MAG: hypothetical protein E5W38_27375, partial [Mesorhizobium sp.]